MKQQLTNLHSGSRVGRQTQEVLAHMPVLRSLHLSFAPALSTGAWRMIANGPAITITTLRELKLDDCHIDMRDFSKLLSSTTTLTRLVHGDVHLYKGFRDDLAQSLLDLANGPCKLQAFTLHFGGIFMGEDEEIAFPSSLQQPCWDTLDSDGEIADEDEWIEIEVNPYIHWKGEDGVQWVLREMASHLQSL